MYCSKCGKELSEGQRFCPDCGTACGGETPTPCKNGKIPYAYYLSLATSPILFIIRMLFQTSETSTPGVNGAWRAATHYIVPGNIRAVMFLLLAASTIIVNKYRNEAPKPADSRVRTAGIMMFVNILLGVSIIMLQF